MQRNKPNTPLPCLLVLLLLCHFIKAQKMDLRICGSVNPPPNTTERIDRKLLPWWTPTTPRLTPTIPVYFHIISNEAGDGALTATDVHNQMAVLNQDFGGKYKFKLEGMESIKNTDWFNHVSITEDEPRRTMKKKLRKGGVSTLNIYSVGFTSSSATGIKGFAAFPSQVHWDVIEDGVVLYYQTFPDGPDYPFNLGKVATHEGIYINFFCNEYMHGFNFFSIKVGHWMGLYHTFQGESCEGPGDYVDDTPQQSTPSSGCPVGKRSCPSVTTSDILGGYGSFDAIYVSDSFQLPLFVNAHSCFFWFFYGDS
jgi:hypothetical protein